MESIFLAILLWLSIALTITALVILGWIAYVLTRDWLEGL